LLCDFLGGVWADRWVPSVFSSTLSCAVDWGRRDSGLERYQASGSTCRTTSSVNPSPLLHDQPKPSSLLVATQILSRALVCVGGGGGGEMTLLFNISIEFGVLGVWERLQCDPVLREDRIWDGGNCSPASVSVGGPLAPGLRVWNLPFFDRMKSVSV
jgi:hypothetical protein